MTELGPRFDPLDPSVVAEPYAAYARLRAESPVCRAGPGQWAVSRYADVSSLLTDGRLRNEFPPAYHEAAHGAGPTAEFVQRILLYSDRPRHRQLRMLLGRSFEPGYLGALRQRVVELAEAPLQRAAESGSFDAVADLAVPLPINVICELLGLPVEDWEVVRPRAIDLGRAFSPGITPHTREIANQAITWLRAYVARFVRERMARPRNDLLSRMVAVWKDHPGIDADEVVDNAVFLFFAGFETTTSLLSTAFALLLEHPEQWERLRADPRLVSSAVEEFLRWDAPIQSRLRLVNEPVEVCGRVLRPGRLVLLLLGAANRDEAQFPRPDVLDVGRTPNAHLSFGAGDHHCLGAALARMEGTIVLSRALELFASLEAAGPRLRDVKNPFRAYAQIPITVQRRGRAS